MNDFMLGGIYNDFSNRSHLISSNLISSMRQQMTAVKKGKEHIAQEESIVSFNLPSWMNKRVKHNEENV